MKYKAVIFDLGGTLCKYVPWSAFEEAAGKMAQVCGAPTEEFIKLYFAHSAGMGTGDFSNYQEYCKHLLNKLNMKVKENIINEAAAFPFALTRQVITPREESIEVLSRLKEEGYKLGLISDCFYDVPEIWPDTLYAKYFDTPIFSCDVGMNKANPEIFNIAMKKLNVKAQDCVYVADGARNELTNAAKLGMKAVQIFIPEERDNSPIREDWRGTTISCLREIFDLL